MTFDSLVPEISKRVLNERPHSLIADSSRSTAAYCPYSNSRYCCLKKNSSGQENFQMCASGLQNDNLQEAFGSFRLTTVWIDNKMLRKLQSHLLKYSIAIVL